MMSILVTRSDAMHKSLMSMLNAYFHNLRTSLSTKLGTKLGSRFDSLHITLTVHTEASPAVQKPNLPAGEDSRIPAVIFSALVCLCVHQAWLSVSACEYARLNIYCVFCASACLFTRVYSCSGRHSLFSFRQCSHSSRMFFNVYFSYSSRTKITVMPLDLTCLTIFRPSPAVP